MKKLHYSLFTALFLVSGLYFQVSAQKDKSKRPSPPAQVTNTVNGVNVTIDYSQPSLKGRELNTLAPIGEVWRTGANEASWIEISDDVKIDGNTLKKGKYGLFTINNGTEWTIIFNEVWDQWGPYDYKAAKDVLRINVSAKTSEATTEQFTITIDTDGATSLKWGDTIVPFTISK
ncbi:MAG: hypothetical protein ACJA08_001552 [Cyclobacteriaceae bacterium]|jgi:hypothetical protein